jgi:hypothetical protein
MTRLHLRPLKVLAAAAAIALAAPAIASAQPLTSIAIVNPGTYLALDVTGGSTEVGAKVIMWYGNFGSNQRWNLVTRSDGTQQVVNQRSGLCLTTNGIAGSQLYQWTCNGSARQEWSGDLKLWASRDYGKLWNPTTGFVLDAQGGGRWAGTAVVGWYDNGADNQTYQYLQFN